MLHAIGAPVGAVFFSRIYFNRFAFTTPLATAAIFVGASLLLDLLVVALLIEKSFDMFSSVLGVWIPQALIFSATYLTGSLMQHEGGVRPGETESGSNHGGERDSRCSEWQITGYKSLS